MADLGLRLTQPEAGPRWLSGERLHPQPGVRPCLKEPSSPSQPPGEEASPPQLLPALPGLTLAAFQLRELQPLFLPTPHPSPPHRPALGLLWGTWQAVGGPGRRSPLLPLLPSSRCQAQV